MSTIEFIVLAIGLVAVIVLQSAGLARARRSDTSNGSAQAFERL